MSPLFPALLRRRFRRSTLLVAAGLTGSMLLAPGCRAGSVVHWPVPVPPAIQPTEDEVFRAAVTAKLNITSADLDQAATVLEATPAIQKKPQ